MMVAVVVVGPRGEHLGWSGAGGGPVDTQSSSRGCHGGSGAGAGRGAGGQHRGLQHSLG